MRIVLLTAIAAVFCGGAFAQAPPIKMGLWEKNMTTDNGDGSPAILKSKSCVTPAEWQEMEKIFTKQREGCSIQTSKTAKGYTFNGTCNIGETQLVINGSTSIPDAEHIVSESHSVSTRNGQKRQTVSKSTSRWVSADCGKVKPGDPEIED